MQEALLSTVVRKIRSQVIIGTSFGGFGGVGFLGVWGGGWVFFVFWVFLSQAVFEPS